MEKEVYTEQIMLGYGLKLVDIFRGDPNQDVLEYLLYLLDSKQREAIHFELAQEAKKICRSRSKEFKNRLTKNLDSAYSDELVIGDVDDYARELVSYVFGRLPNLHSWFMRTLGTRIHGRLRILKAKALPTKEHTLLRERTEQLAEIFALSEKELEIVTFFFLYDTNDKIEEVFSTDDLKMDVVYKSVKNYCRFFDIAAHELREILKKDAPLVRSGIIVKGSGRHHDDLDLSSHILSFLCGLSSDNLTSQFFEKAPTPTRLALKDFPIPVMNTAVMENLLRSNKGINILLHGTPGTGKTEFAKAIAKSLDVEVMFVKQTDEDGEEDLSYRKTALVAAQNMLQDRPCILVVDECDPIINTNGGLFMCDRGEKKDEKSWINHYTERSSLKIIWISNKIGGIDDSTKRRFSYAQEFRNPGINQRLKAWNIQKDVHDVKFLDSVAIEQMARSYSVSPGVIDLALRDVIATRPDAEPKDQMTMLQNILEQQQTFCVGKKSALAPISSKYSLQGLNMDTSPEKITNSVKMFLERQTTPSKDIKLRNLNILLVGPPGTGKTEFVKHIAQEVDRELLVKRTSDLISKWVGESEQNIASVFADAEQMGAILFLDEADSLFINREGATHSWEISQTNELLCQMENFSGILMCATNFQNSMDLAVMRRFTYKVGLDYLKPEGNELFFDRILGPLLKDALTDEDRVRIREIKNLAPGDFKVVFQKYAYEGSVSTDDLIRALETEVNFGHRRGIKSSIGLAGK